MCTFDRYKNQETGKDVRNDDIKLVQVLAIVYIFP